MEVVYEGSLEIGCDPNSKSSRDWKARLFVLKRHPTTGRATLDYYKSTSKRWQKQSICGVISLWPEFEISLAHECSYKFSLKLATTERVVLLASSSHASMNKWFYHIQTQRLLEPDRDTYLYTVQPQDSDFMAALGAFGDCQLAVTPNLELQCALLPSKQILAIWPFDCLKSFSYGSSLFSFKAGRHSPRGPGDYAFITSQDYLIHSRIEKFIEKARRGSGSSASSSRISLLDSRPPAMLPFDHKSSSSDSSSDIDMEHFQDLTKFKTKEDTSKPPPPDRTPPKILPKGVSPSKSSSSTTWLHERFGPSVEPEESSKPTRPPKPEDLEDHVYSHTQHIMPTNQFMQQSVANSTIYNSLQHQGPGGGASSHYEMAYPHGKTTSLTYDTAYKKENTPPQPSQPLQPKANGRDMTVNPLYGSQNNLLDEEEVPTGQQPTGQQVSVPDVTANPVYVTSNIRHSESPPTPFKSMPIQLDHQGYTKINKDGTKPKFLSSADSDGPPPIPERQYSMSEDADSPPLDDSSDKQPPTVQACD